MPCTRTTVATLAVLLVSGAALTVVTGTAASASDYVIPDDAPGPLNESSYHRYWADDADDNSLNMSDFDGENATSRTEFERRLARTTDIPFDHPPAAVEDWNSDDFGDYDPGGTDASVHPENATLRDWHYIKDGFVEIFAIQPSTILVENETSHHVAPEGEVRATSDYRIELPEDDTTGPHRQSWSVLSSRIKSLELSANNTTLDSGSGHQATFEYSSLSGRPTLTVEANITATIRRVTRRCTDWNYTSNNCEGTWEKSSLDIPTARQPSVSRDAVVNKITGVDGRRVRFEKDANLTGANVHPDTRWSEITVDGDVRARSNWWFYSAGKTGWRGMVTETESGASKENSSVRPLQVHAFPSEEEPYVPGTGANGTTKLKIEETWGTNHSGPSSPPNIDLDAADPYENADSIALSSTELDRDSFQEVSVDGVVRGQSQTVPLANEAVVRETELELSFSEMNSTRATVLAEVTENETGEPVTSGTVTVLGQTSSVNASGEAVFTLARPRSFILGEYTPVHWWRTTDPVASSSDYARPPAEFPDFESFTRFVVVTILWFLPLAAVVLGFDYATNGAFLGIRKQS